MAHAQKPDLVFPRNGRVHLNRWGRQFSRLLTVEVCASAWVMLDTPRSEMAWEYWLPTPFASFPFTSPPLRHRVTPGSERALPLFSNKNVFNKRFYELHLTFEISGFRRKVAKNWAFLDYYAASSGNFLPKFRSKLSVPFSGFKVSDGRREVGLHRHSICLLAELTTKGKICRIEDMPKYDQSVSTRVLTEEVKGLHHRHAAEPGNYAKTNRQILRSDS